MKNFLFMCSLILIFTIRTFAENIELDIKSAIEIALENNLTLKSKEIDLKIKKRFLVTSKFNRFIPSVSVSTGVSHLNEDNPLYETPEWALGWQLNAQLPIYLAIFDGIKYTVLDYQAGKINLEKAKKNLSRDVKKAFYNLILFQKRIDLLSQSLATAEKRYKRAKINFDAGVISELDLLTVQVTYENIKPALEDLTNAYNIAVLFFKQMLGIKRTVNLKFKGSIDAEQINLNSDILIQKNLNNNLDYLSLKKFYEQTKNLLKGKRHLEFLPTILLSYTMDPSLSTNPFESLSGDWSQQTGAFTIGVSINIDNFFPGSVAMTELLKLNDTVKQTELGLTELLQNTEIQIETMVRNINKSVGSIETMELNVVLAQKAYDLSEIAYNEGTIDILDVENAEDNLDEANLNLLSEKYNYIISLFDLEYALNSSAKEIIKQGKN